MGHLRFKECDRCLFNGHETDLLCCCVSRLALSLNILARSIPVIGPVLAKEIGLKECNYFLEGDDRNDP